MTRHREARLNEQLKREISGILARKVRDPRADGVLVTDVRVTADLWLARVYVRPSPEGDPEEMMAGLEAAAPFVRRELGRVLHVRRIPELRFHHDTTLDAAQRIEEVLREVRPGGAEEEGGAGPEPDGRDGEG